MILCSTFQHPFYPGSGAATSAKNAVNIPIAVGGGREEFRDAVNNHWLPALKRFKPEMIFISAGFDAHRDDNMANLNLKKSDYAWLTKVIKTLAEKCAHGRIVSVLEGGYELKSLAECVSAHIKVLRGDNNLELKLPFFWKSPEGSVFTLRELNPTDTKKLETFTSELCFQSRYYRFGNGDYKPKEADLAEVCTSKHDKLLHLVVTIMVGGKEVIIGSSRCVINRKKNECEFSLVVADHWQRQGIALRLVESLIRLMRPKGIRKMRAKVLDTNLKMLHFVDQLGFKVKAGPKNKWLKIATLTLD